MKSEATVFLVDDEPSVLKADRAASPLLGVQRGNVSFTAGVP